MSRQAASSDPRSVLVAQLANTGNGMMAADARQKIILWNQAAEALLGYTAAEVLGKPCFQVIQARDCLGSLSCCENCSLYEQARQQQWSSHQVIQVPPKRGDAVRLHVITFGLQSPGRRFSGLLHIFWSAAEAQPLARAPAPILHGDTGETPLAVLSGRERAVLRCLAAGMDTKTAASVLYISPTTVRNHTQNILRKLGVHSCLEAVLMATRHPS